jgi:hypothetical protein
MAYNLNTIQSEFLFSFDEVDSIAYPSHVKLNKPIPDEVLKTHAQDYLTKKYKNEYGIAICDRSLRGKILTSSDNVKAIVTTKGWEVGGTGDSVEKAVVYGLVDILLESLGIMTPTHDRPRACPMDYGFGQKRVLRACLKTADFCSDCRSLILEEMGKGKITLQQFVAIYRILDFVAHRKSCFVLMPFEKRFKRLYTGRIKPILTNRKWVCNISEEIHEGREVISIIWEQILRADLIIADLSGRNPNVFYELGYAHALGKRALLLTQEINDVPFDLRHRQLVEYTATPKGYRNLSQAVLKYL